MQGIIDSTLREGAQAPGVNFSFLEKIRIIRHLSRLGIEEIETGVASSGCPELPLLVRAARRAVEGRSRISLWCRCRAEDIRFAALCGPDVLSLSLPVSDLHLQQKLGRSRSWALAVLTDAIAAAGRHGFHAITLGLEDATRAHPAFLADILRAAQSAGAERIRLADTVGIATPGMIKDLVRHAKNHCSLPLGIHAHNDFGMATANSVAALEAGASWADATVLGLGERAGSSRLEELVGYLVLAAGMERYEPALLPGLCSLVARAAKRPISAQHPIVGSGIFTCETGLHVQGLFRDPATYEPFAPDRVGRCRHIRFGGKTGKKAIRNGLAAMGLRVSEEEAAYLAARVRQMAGIGNSWLNCGELLHLARNKQTRASGP